MDLYLKAVDEQTMNKALLDAGVVYEGDGVLYPIIGVSLDIIGPFTRIDYATTPPTSVVYPEWHVNLRSWEFTDAQLAVLQPFTLVTPEEPYRVWA